MEPGRSASEVTEEHVDDVLDEFGGDARAAIAALLHDIGVLAADQAVMAANVSTGFLRRRQPDPPPRALVVRVTESKVSA